MAVLYEGVIAVWQCCMKVLLRCGSVVRRCYCGVAVLYEDVIVVWQCCMKVLLWCGSVV